MGNAISTAAPAANAIGGSNKTNLSNLKQKANQVVTKHKNTSNDKTTVFFAQRGKIINKDAVRLNGISASLVSI